MRIGLAVSIGGGSPGVPFGETDLEGIVLSEGGLWLKGNSGKTITAAPDISPHTPYNSATWGNFANATAGQRPHDSTVDGVGSVQYIAANSQNLRSSLAAANWNFLHQTGFSFCTVVELGSAGGVIWDGPSTGTSLYGSFLQSFTGSNNILWTVAAGTARITHTFTNAFSGPEKIILDGGWTHEYGWYFSKNGGVPATGRWSGAADATAATDTLHIGSGAPGSFGYWDGQWLDGIWTPGMMTYQNRRNMLNYFATKHSITLADEWPTGYLASTEELFV